MSIDEILTLGKVLGAVTVTGLLGFALWAAKRGVWEFKSSADARVSREREIGEKAVAREREIAELRVAREREVADLERKDKNEWKATAYKALGLAEVGAELVKKAGS